VSRRPPFPADTLARARDLQAQIFTLDGHVDLPPGVVAADLAGAMPETGQFDLARAREGGVSAAALTLFSGQTRGTPADVARAQRDVESQYAAINDLLIQHATDVGLARSPADLRRLAEEGRFAIVLGLQNAGLLGADLAPLEDWVARGVRVMAFSHFGNNPWADSSRPFAMFGDRPDALGGLSELGKRGVRRLNDLGVLVDVSQMTSLALAETLSVSKAPVIASHSAVRSQVDIGRNLSDLELRDIAAGEGVVQIIAFSAFLRPFSAETLLEIGEVSRRFGLPAPRDTAEAFDLSHPETADWSDERLDDYRGDLHAILDRTPLATLQDFGKAIDHAVGVAGIDHVGISSDFNQHGGVVGWAHAGESVNVTAELITRGYADDEIAKLWGGNFLRVWDAVEAVARSLQPRPGDKS